MKASRYQFALDMHDVQSQVCLMATEGDTMREFVINLCEGGEAFTAEGVTSLQMLIEGPDRKVRAEFGDNNPRLSEDCSQVIYRFTNDTCPNEGLYECKIVFYGDAAQNEVLWTPCFSIFAGKKKQDRMTL